ncbi:hypothetical protein MAHJHV57_54760 [Mycobacterium avium subsp. hominissuis]
MLAALHGWLAPLPPEGASAIVFRDTDHAAASSAAWSVSRNWLRHKASGRAICWRRASST